MEQENHRQMAEIASTLDEIYRQLSDTELKFLSARVRCDTNREAARVAKIPEATVYSFPHKALVDEAVRLIAQDGVSLAIEMLRRAVTKAAEVKVSGLDEKSVTVRQAVSSEILDRAGLGVAQKVDVTSGGQPVTIYIPANGRDAPES